MLIPLFDHSQSPLPSTERLQLLSRPSKGRPAHADDMGRENMPIRQPQVTQ
ncbi:hypothetical protein CY34DRAFT_19841 [Suillus luteus UH-Slu-Lm8-n1]|uniref:Uncharacterized protein n=1 Tax=Suillus luteus UH-Slu-Lm8-n1 TaxID=930992 RepID=A0A0C9Z260_9AGAM|nr:hypothetical protein CY34DRAFT_19841 [Suillus luteus UH-Slu-Lm8-n1]